MRKITKIAIFAVAFAFLSLPVFAERSIEPNTSAVGIYGMGWTGNQTDTLAGLQYQHWFNNLGLQFTLGGFAKEDIYYDYLDDDDYKNKEFLNVYLSSGLHIMYSIFSTPQDKPFYTRFYIWGMGGAVGTSDYDTDFFVNACAGVGIGAEFVFWHRMSIPVEFGFAGSFPKHPNMSFSGAAGIRFRF